MPLEGTGYWCTSLDLGSPTVREVVNNRPDARGVIDRTSLLGSRLVSADITALSTAGGRIDEIAAAFGPYMDPAARPTLHYVLDRGDDSERTLVLRGANYDWPIVGPIERDIQLQWVAADPVAMGATTNVVTAWAGSSAIGGRSYPFHPPRSYPAGGGGPAAGRLVSPGDLSFQPYLRIYGPITAPSVSLIPDVGGAPARCFLRFLPGVVIGAGQFIGIDTRTHAAYVNDDPTRPMLSQLDWTYLRWPDLAPAPQGWTMTLTGSSTTGTSQVQASWRDRYFA